MIDAGGGSVVNIASMLGHVGSTPVKQAAYCASEGTVVNLTRETSSTAAGPPAEPRWQPSRRASRPL